MNECYYCRRQLAWYELVSLSHIGQYHKRYCPDCDKGKDGKQEEYDEREHMW